MAEGQAPPRPPAEHTPTFHHEGSAPLPGNGILPPSSPRDPAPLRHWTDALAAFLIRRPHWVHLASLVLLAIAACVIAFGVKFNSDVLDLFPSHFDSVQVWKTSNREFAQGRALSFALHDETGQVDLAEFAHYFGEALRKEPWVVRAMDQLPLMSGDEETLADGQALLLPILLNLPPAEFASVAASLRPEAIRQRVGESLEKFKAGSMKEDFLLSVDPLGVLTPAFKQLGASGAEQTFSLFSPDETVHLVLAVTDQTDLGAHASQEMMRKVDDFRARALAGWEGPKPEVLVTGRTAYVGELSRIMRADVLTTLATSALLVSVVFWLGFRRVRPLVAILHVLLLSCGIAVGLGAAVFHELNMITIGLCAILIGLGVDFGMMFYSIYEIERGAGRSHQDAIAGALRAQSRSVVFGALTSAAGFFSHASAAAPALRSSAC